MLLGINSKHYYVKYACDRSKGQVGRGRGMGHVKDKMGKARKMFLE